MPREYEVTVLPGDQEEIPAIRHALKERYSLSEEEIRHVYIIKRSLDARRGKLRWHYRVGVSGSTGVQGLSTLPSYKDVDGARPVYIAGSGPAGLFCALRLLELGFKPVIFERGKEVHERKRDVARISREHVVDPESNYCFGEGGAGTFSDGKLYTRSRKRGDMEKILRILAGHGAPGEILYDAHPHIGTDRLPGVVKSIRKTILDQGGEIHFLTRLDSLKLSQGKLSWFETNTLGRMEGAPLVLATGHSARDVYRMLDESGVRMEMKGFAMGVRVEHPQELIDHIQYHGLKRPAGIPAATYQLVAHAGNRGVYSFCMCPGGFMVPSATSGEEVVVNGMSPWGRNSSWANSGIVVELGEKDIPHLARHGVMAGLRFQENLEKEAWYRGGRTQQAPAQRLTDFVRGRHSGNLPSSSYFPGLVASPLHEWLPVLIRESLQLGFRFFDSRMKGFLTDEALVAGVESRTSSPIRISRDPLSHLSVNCDGLFPCGEGSGYAGGILSSAMDGEHTAEKVAEWIRKRE